MKIIKTQIINSPIDQAWEILGPGYVRAGEWASSVYASMARAGTPVTAQAPVAGRVCETSIGAATETLIDYSPDQHRIAYTAQAEKMPGFVKGLTNIWELKSIGKNQTEVTMTFDMELAAPFHVLMGWIMRLQMNSLLGKAVEEFAYFVETGQPHPRKVRIDQSKIAMAARAAHA